MRPTDIRLAGAVPLDPKPAAPPTAGAGGGGTVVDVTEASFATEVLDRSRTVPVVIDFWADWCGPCKALSPVLERLAAADGGRWVLAKIDVDANQRLAAQFRVQSIPTVVAVYDGALVNAFMGAQPEATVRAWLDEVLAAAGDATAGAPAPAPPDPGYAEAAAAAQRGDLDAAAAAFSGVLERNPGEADARRGLAGVELLRRVAAMDERAVRRRAAAAPEDVAAATALADLYVADGQVDEAVDLLLGLVRRLAGAEREQARRHLVALFDVLDPADDRVRRGRRELASALF